MLEIARSLIFIQGKGLAGVIWAYIWTFIGFGFVIASLAEMAPISGGQYRWVSEFAPPKYQGFLSYITSWMSTSSWQAGNASRSFLTGTIAQALLTINYPDYAPQNWQGTLFVFAMVLIYVVNIWGAQLCPSLLPHGLVTWYWLFGIHENAERKCTALVPSRRSRKYL